MSGHEFEKALEQKFPHIDWRKPLRMASLYGTGLACRFCIAQQGIKAADIPHLPQNIAEFHQHMKEYHENRKADQ